VYGPLKGEKVIRGWRKLNNEELQELYSSSNNISVIKFRRI
jgi:hypothetical protein